MRLRVRWIAITDAIDVTGYDSDVKTSVDIKPYIPEGTSIVGGDDASKIDVTVYIEKEITKEFRIDTDRIHTTGVPEGMAIELDEEESSIKIELQGLRKILGTTDSSTIVGIVDVDKYMNDEELTSLSTGTHTMPVTFTLPDGVKLTRECRVRVKVKSTEQ